MGRKSIIGARVRLLRDVETQAGTKFKKGVIMGVVDSTSGGLTLQVQVREYSRSIRGISRSSVEVIGYPVKEE